MCHLIICIRKCLVSDKREDMIEVGDEITIDNSQDTDSISDVSDFGATVHFDKKVYTWTDKVHITVTSPFHNFDSDAVEEIGATQPYAIRMHTSNSDMDSYKLVETGLIYRYFYWRGNPYGISP